ncbi:PhzF family phenazine biosynthesis isomerase [Nakamurella sp. YIM 132087]|uniref:PhzF family phenazine biosynthesis isomerase n=1 Tax=Nakamurella alba TaxID=2665158 RepID=A0A7K1FIC2_9ACTN|nr:PhzF family phenazine biosynthesis protein [Nakamurella alba]MTD13877.1 PhzF family phenazine biosynthesis isomerase [Nakamurella alba]
MRFSQIDVFTDEFLLGNPVAVVHDADTLDDATMAAFARWTNLSETTFLLSPTDPAADYRLRIFTAAGELPFAGHPTLGSARAWLEAGGVPHRSSELVQECGVGLVRVRITDQRLAFAAPPRLRSGPVSEADLAAVLDGLGLRPDEILGAQWADNGPGWLAVLLRGADAVLALQREELRLDGVPNIGVVGAYPPGSPAQYEVRAFVSREGEDPVTGSLNASIAQWLIGAGIAPRSYLASQGTRLQRRGRVSVEAVGDDIWVGGGTVVGITGEVALGAD